MFNKKQTLTILALVIAVAMAAPYARGQDKVDLSFNAFAVNMGTVHTGATNTMTIKITRWSTDEERQKLFETIVEKDQDAVIKVLQDMDETGWARLNNRPGMAGTYPHRGAWGMRGSGGAGAGMWGAGMRTFPSERLRFARKFEKDGGHSLYILALDRAIPYWEAVGQPRTIDYPLTIIVLEMDEKGEGEGKLAIGVQLTYDKDKKRIELENFSSEPVRLTKVHQDK